MRLRPHRRILDHAGDLRWPATRKPRLAVWKFASCDGCQLSLLDCEDELLAVAGAVEIAYFPEASQRDGERSLRPVSGRRLDHHAARRRTHSQGAPAVEVSGDDRRLRDRRRHPGAAQFRRRQRLRRRRLRVAAIHQNIGDLDADFRARDRWISSCAVARSTRRSCWK